MVTKPNETGKNGHAKRRVRRYPWEEWFRSGSFTVYRARDFNGRTDTFLQQVRQAASRLRYSVSVETARDGGWVTVTVVGRLPRRTTRKGVRR
jgi:hypothetical protein